MRGYCYSHVCVWACLPQWPVISYWILSSAQISASKTASSLSRATLQCSHYINTGTVYDYKSGRESWLHRQLPNSPAVTMIVNWMRPPCLILRKVVVIITGVLILIKHAFYFSDEINDTIAAFNSASSHIYMIACLKEFCLTNVVEHQIKMSLHKLAGHVFSRKYLTKPECHYTTSAPFTREGLNLYCCPWSHFLTLVLSMYRHTSCYMSSTDCVLSGSIQHAWTHQSETA